MSGVGGGCAEGVGVIVICLLLWSVYVSFGVDGVDFGGGAGVMRARGGAVFRSRDEFESGNGIDIAC